MSSIPFGSYLEERVATLTVIGGDASGAELVLDQRRTLLGRGPGVDFAFDDPAMSAEHAAIEFGAEGFELQRRNGASVLLNGQRVQRARLKHGDWFALGSIRFEYRETPR